MSDEISPNIVFKEYLNTRLGLERELANERWDGHWREHRLTAMALGKAEETMTMRLEGMNELRAQLNSQQNNFVTKDMLIPFQSFIDKFTGSMIGFTVLNLIVTLVIAFVIKLWH